MRIDSRRRRRRARQEVDLIIDPQSESTIKFLWADWRREILLKHSYRSLAGSSIARSLAEIAIEAW